MALISMPGSATSSAGDAATITESPTAVTSVPATCASGVALGLGDGDLTVLAVLVLAVLVLAVLVLAGGSARPMAAPCPPPPARPAGLAANENSLAPANTHTTKAPTIPPPR